MPRKARRAPDGLRVVGYSRVSSVEQAMEGVSLAAQRVAVRAYAEAHGLMMLEIIEDAGISAAIPLAERPGGARLAALVRDGSVGGVVAVKLDRLFRDALDALAVTRAWDELSVALHLIDLRIDTSSAVGRLFLTVIAAVAEMERGLIAERTASALAHLKAQGVRIGRDGLGWTRTDAIDEHGRRVVQEIPDEVGTMARIRELRRRGHAYAAIAEQLAADGTATKRGGRWHATTVRNVVLRTRGRRCG